MTTIRHILKVTVTLAVLITFHLGVSAQGIVKGVVSDESNGESVPFANVVLDGTRFGCATDINGFFLINKVPAGNYTLRVRFVGYDEYTTTITVKDGKTQNIAINLKPSAQMLDAVDVTDSRIEERRMQTQVSVEKITASQIQQMPSIGGQADLAQYMQVLPGVSSTGDQGGQLYIRGGSMIQNLCLLDGMTIYNPFHSIGLYSIFETDVILNADIYTGGFGAEYGGRLSSVMDITTRDGNKRHHSGKIGLNTFGASLILEGPLKKESNESKSAVTYLVTAKNSYLSKTSEIIYPYLQGGLPFDFLDLYGKLTLNSGTGSKVSFFGFNFDDSVSNYKAIADYHWRNYGLGTNFTLVTGSTANLNGSVAYSNYNITLRDGSGTDKHSKIGGFNATMQITNYLGNNRIKYGISMEGYRTDYYFENMYGNVTRQAETPTTNLSAFVTYKWVTDKLLMDPGLRICYYATLRTPSLEPRLALKYNLRKDTRFKLAAGHYSQVFLDARSDNDIVNLFTGFLTGVAALNIPGTFLGDEVETCLQTADHVVAGVEYDLTEHTTLNAEVYYKRFGQLLNANHDKQFDRDDPAYQPGGMYEKPEYMMTDYIIEKGYATGFDVNICADLERLYFWGTYSLAFVRRTNEVQTYAPHYDRRHTVNLLATYALGESREWELSGRWSFGSGFPFTQTQGVFQGLNLGGSIAGNYTTENGDFSIHYADLYKGRLPSYHRLDLGLKRKFSIGKRSLLELTLSVTNVYSRENIFYFDRATFERVNQLPILACLGANFTF